jgi:hypothetical protein
VSLLFTLSVLIGTVVTIYLVLPARHNVLLTAAIEHHRDTDPSWDLENPTAGELRAWAIGMIGKEVPLPTNATKIIGARRVEVLHRSAAMIRLQIGSDEVTYLVQTAHGIAPVHVDERDGELRATYWRRGKFTCVAVGPDATAASWLAMFAKK